MRLDSTQRKVLGALLEYCNEMREAPPPYNMARPQDIGGTDSSYHSRVLRELCELGLAHKAIRNGTLRRPSYRYRITPLGRRIAKQPR